MPSGKHGHKMREYKRRIDSVLAKERERRRPLSPPPPAIDETHASLRREILELYRTLRDLKIPEGPDQMTWLEERMLENPELASLGAKLITLKREERRLLAKHGVDSRPYEVYQLE